MKGTSFSVSEWSEEEVEVMKAGEKECDEELSLDLEDLSTHENENIAFTGKNSRTIDRILFFNYSEPHLARLSYPPECTVS